MVGTNDIKKSKQFYDSIMGCLGYEPGMFDNENRFFYFTMNGIFGVTKPIDGKPATHANGGTIGFTAESTVIVDTWQKTGVKNGGSLCEGLPNTIKRLDFSLYVAYLRDPDGNKICALHNLV